MPTRNTQKLCDVRAKVADFLAGLSADEKQSVLHAVITSLHGDHPPSEIEILTCEGGLFGYVLDAERRAGILALEHPQMLDKATHAASFGGISMAETIASLGGVK